MAVWKREEVERAVLSGKADLGIAHLPAHERLQVWPLASDAYVLVVPQKLTLSTAPRWETLTDLHHIQLHCSGALGVTEACRQAGLRHHPVMQLREDTDTGTGRQEGWGSQSCRGWRWSPFRAASRSGLWDRISVENWGLSCCLGWGADPPFGRSVRC